MTFTYSPSAPATSLSQVRLLIPDTDATSGGIFSDEEIAALLALEGGSVRRAAAQALDVIASSEVYTQKVIKLLDLSTDGAKVSAELRARAADLRTQAAIDDSGADGGFEVAEWWLGNSSFTDYSARRMWQWGY